MSFRPRLRKRVTLDNFEPTRTEQSHKEACDINFILKRFNQTGQLPDMIKSNPQYGDFSNVSDYQESLNVVMKAQSQFAALSSVVREKFHNQPEEFLKFVSDPKNSSELVELGLANSPKASLDDVVSALKSNNDTAKVGKDSKKKSSDDVNN